MNSIYIDFSRRMNDLLFIFDIMTLTRIYINLERESHLEDVNNRLFFQRMHNSPHIQHITIIMDECKIPRYDVIHKFLNQYIDIIEIYYLHGHNFKDSNFFALIEAIQNYPNITRFGLMCIHDNYSFPGEKFMLSNELICPKTLEERTVVVNKNNLYDFFQKYDVNFNHDRCVDVINDINSLYTVATLYRGNIRQYVLKGHITISDIRSFFNEIEMNKLCDILTLTNLTNFRIKVCINDKSQYDFNDLFSKQQQTRINDSIVRTNVKSARNI